MCIRDRSVSQEVLAHKPMLEKYAREYGIEEYLNVLLAIIPVAYTHLDVYKRQK